MRGKIALICTLAALMLLTACSTKKNTPLTRRVQAFKAHYNTYFNGHQAYLEGIEAQRTGNKDNYMEMIPLFMTGNKSTATLGKGNFDRTIEKCQKTIKLHSITARPEAKKTNRRRTEKEKIWLTQKEYNPFLYKAWFLLGEAQFHKGEYMEAASTFAYIQRLYFSKPNIIAKARILEAKCYAELKWFYEAEDLLNRAGRDSVPERLFPVRDAILADCQIGQKQFREAIPNVRNAIRKAQGNYQKARMYFLLGQLYEAVGDNQNAYKAFKKVPGKNPPYELAFNARVKMTEVMSEGDSKRMIHRLKSMARNPKNKDYLDQVYYAIGNIYLAHKDTLHAMWAYNDGVEKSTRNGVEKGVVWLHLGQLYWEQEKFVKAKDCYAGALGLFDKEREDYKAVDERTKILEELYPHASAVELQDSLQALALMDSVERMKVIEKIIEEVKKKEKEEAKKAANANTPTSNAANAARTAANQAAANQMNRNQQGGVWYFYNPSAITSGATEFEKKWGKRELADDWNRSNKTVLADEEEQSDEETEEGDVTLDTANDSIPAAEGAEGAAEGQEELSEEEKKALEKQAEYEADPHRPEYYLKDIPFTEEQMAASNAALVDGLYNSAIIYKDRMGNFPLAEKTFNRVLTDFPDFEHTDDIYYNMFQLYARQGMSTEADDFKNRLIAQYPENEHVKVISDPNFEYKARHGHDEEDSLYQDAYENYKANNFHSVIFTSQHAQESYPEGANRARFMFLEAMSQLEVGNRTEFLTTMKSIVDNYPKSTVSELAGLYVKGVREGRILTSGKMEMGSVWDRRAGFLLEGDSILTDTAFTDTRDDIHVFVVAYEHNSLNENQLLYEMARYDFQNFPVRNFDINIERGDGIDMLQIRPFLNYDEAYIYLRKLEMDEEMGYKMEGLKYFIISSHNLNLITRRGMSFTDYFAWYDETYNAEELPEYDENLLNEPAEVPNSEDQTEETKPEETEEQKQDFDGNIEDFGDETDTTQPVEEQGDFLNDATQQDDNQQNVVEEERGEFFDDLETEQNDQQNETVVEEEVGEFFDDLNQTDETPVEEQTYPVLDEQTTTEEEATPVVEDNTTPVVEEDTTPEVEEETIPVVEDTETEAESETDNTTEQTTTEQNDVWDGNVEDFDDEEESTTTDQTDVWDGNVEDFDDEGTDANTDTNVNTNDNWDDEEDEDYIF